MLLSLLPLMNSDSSSTSSVQTGSLPFQITLFIFFCAPLLAFPSSSTPNTPAFKL